MTNTELLHALVHALGSIDERYIEEYDSFHPKQRFGRLAAAAASVVLVLAVGLWLMLPADLGLQEQVMRSMTLVIDGWMASYRIHDDYDLTNFESLTLPARMGELYTSNSRADFYRVKGKTGIDSLIMKNHKGELYYLTFSGLHALLPDMSASTLYTSGLLTDHDLANLRYGETYDIGYLLKTVYGVTSADGITSVRFSDPNIDKTDVGDRVPVKTVTLRNDASIEQFYRILSSIERTKEGILGVYICRIFSDDAPYQNGELPLSEQTERKVTVKLSDGDEITMRFCPTVPSLNGERISHEDAAWLIEAAEIDMIWRDWGTNEQPKSYNADETTSRPQTAAAD